VLAGFAFAAVVLVVQENVGDPVRREIVAISFLLAFFGCVAAAFNFATISGQEGPSTRSFTMGLLAGGGFGISTLYIFWGLVVLMSIFLSPLISQVAFLLFITVALASPTYLIAAMLDINRHAQRPHGSLPLLVIFAYLPLLVAILLRGFLTLDLSETVYILVAVIALLLIALGAVLTLVTAQLPRTTVMPYSVNAGWIVIHSLLFALLVVLLPHV
jgi:hypothetical protein